VGGGEGVSEQQLADLPTFEESPAFSELERRVLRYVVALTRRPAEVPEELFNGLREDFNPQQMVELTSAIAWENFRAHFTYRMIVVRMNLSKEKGEQRLLDEIRYFFYLTNDWVAEPAEVVLAPQGANGRCQQENVLAQLHNGCCALRAAVDSLESNWAYMVMTGLAWSLKAWWALLLPEAPGRWQDQHRADKRWVLGLEFKTFVQAFVRLPCQLARTGRKLVYRLLSWNPYQPILFRLHQHPADMPDREGGEKRLHGLRPDLGGCFQDADGGLVHQAARSAGAPKPPEVVVEHPPASKPRRG
jgi:hypothetical protein